MKRIIKKLIVFITAVAIMLTLAMPMSAEAANKKAPKLNKTKTTLTITKKKTKPTVLLKVKNVAGRKVKWATSNKKVAAVSKNGKVVAKKKGTAIITVKVKGSKTLRCKVTVKDNRKPVTNPSPAPNPTTNDECEHEWVDHQKLIDIKIACSCGRTFDTTEQWSAHNLQIKLNGEQGHSYSDHEIYETDYQECTICHKTRPVP